MPSEKGEPMSDAQRPTALLRELERNAIELDVCVPTQLRGWPTCQCWSIVVTDPDSSAVGDRYEQYVHRAGLELNQLRSSRRRKDGTIAVAIVVRTRKEEE